MPWMLVPLALSAGAFAQEAYIVVTPATCAPGETLQAEVILEPEPEGEVSYVWSTEEDAGAVPFDGNPVTVTCPTCRWADHRNVLLQATAWSDELGLLDIWTDYRVLCPADSGLTEDSGGKGRRGECGCASSAPPSAGALLTLLGLLLGRRRRGLARMGVVHPDPVWKTPSLEGASSAARGLEG
ncbi:MAG: hypothetical protein H6741_30960 [Alphaproteobacteria bacterium]|nr:hypothetical protein [Alphaproteobacteria bacterium]